MRNQLDPFKVFETNAQIANRLLQDCRFDDLLRLCDFEETKMFLNVVRRSAPFLPRSTDFTYTPERIVENISNKIEPEFRKRISDTRKAFPQIILVFVAMSLAEFLSSKTRGSAFEKELPFPKANESALTFDFPFALNKSWSRTQGISDDLFRDVFNAFDLAHSILTKGFSSRKCSSRSVNRNPAPTILQIAHHIERFQQFAARVNNSVFTSPQMKQSV